MTELLLLLVLTWKVFLQVIWSFHSQKKKQSHKYGFDQQEVDKELLYMYLINVFAFNFDKL